MREGLVERQSTGLRVDTTSPSKGYLLTLTYAGQQIAGLRGLLSQRCWASSHKLPAYLVEPFVRKSHLIHSVDVWRDRDAGISVKRLSDYYRIEYGYYNRSEVTQIVSWERFLVEAPRKLILVYVHDIQVKNCPFFKPEGCVYKRNSNPIEYQHNCTNTGDSEEAIMYLKQYNFDVVQTLCLVCVSTAVSTNKTLYSQLYSKYHPRSVTVIFNQWKFHVQSELTCQDVPPWCSTDLSISTRNLQFSSELQLHADNYIKSVIKNNKFVAVMLRLEWYLIMLQHSHNITNCLHNIAALYKEQIPQWHEAFVTTDIGKFGSVTLNDTLAKFGKQIGEMNYITEQIETILGRTFQSIWQFEDVDGLREKIGNDVGYIAALQGTIASRSSCLYLLGGGHFQKMVLEVYLNTHHRAATHCVKLICMPNNFNRMFSKMISQAPMYV